MNLLVAEPRARVGLVALAVLFSMLCGTLNITAVRPFFAAYYDAEQSLMHAFVALHALGATIGGPLFAWRAERMATRKKTAILLAILDAVLLAINTLEPPVWVLLGLRILAGAASVGALSILMSATRAPGDTQQKSGIGLAGAAVIGAIALGPPIGTLLLGWDVRAPFWAGSFAGLIASALVYFAVPATMDALAPAKSGLVELLRHTPDLRLAALWVGAERLAIGSFVVTFAIYANSALALDDSQIGVMYSALLIPFALATWFCGRAAERGLSRALFRVGGIAYAVSYLLLGRVDAFWAVPVLIIAGLGSAAIYAPCLHLAASAPPENLRATAMGVVNASGTVGMFLGTAFAGIATVALNGFGFDARETCTAIFALGAVIMFVLSIVAIPRPGRVHP